MKSVGTTTLPDGTKCEGIRDSELEDALKNLMNVLHAKDGAPYFVLLYPKGKTQTGVAFQWTTASSKEKAIKTVARISQLKTPIVE